MQNDWRCSVMCQLANLQLIKCRNADSTIYDDDDGDDDNNNNNIVYVPTSNSEHKLCYPLVLVSAMRTDNEYCM